jgi:hypothetical protein
MPVLLTGEKGGPVFVAREPYSRWRVSASPKASFS